MILLDTHILLWLRFGDSQIGIRSRKHIEQALQYHELAVSAFSFWEVSMLHAKGRIKFLSDIKTWRMTLLKEGLFKIPVNGEIGICANTLANFHSDPADRIIAATAMGGHPLLTADERILSWNGALNRLDARQ